MDRDTKYDSADRVRGLRGSVGLVSIPEHIARYSVLEEVGRGGMAVVYRGVDQSLDREVAIKILHAHLANDPESRARFQREARAVARLHHPHIIEIFDFADVGEGPTFIVTEFIKGETLKAFIEHHQAFFPEVAVMIAIQLCEAVGHAHGLQIIHRDLKPENVMVDQNGTLKLMDFGIAKVIDQQQQMTLTGSILGSPAHMAPELLEGKELDIRSDLFSIGTILYWLATGNLPFSGKNPHQILKAIIEGVFPDPQRVNPVVGSDLARIIRRALAHKPEERFPSAASMQSALHGLLADLELSELDSELKFFFASPKNFIEGLKEKILRRLLQHARALLRERKHRAALEVLDRLLALQPGHAEVLALVDTLHRHQRWRRALLLSSAAVIALPLIVAVWITVGRWSISATEDRDGGAVAARGSLAQPDGGAPRDEPAAVDGSADGAARGAAGDTIPVEDNALAQGDQRLGAHGRPDHRLAPDHLRPAPVVRHRVVVFTEPFFDRVLIDGKEVATADEATQYGQVFSRELPAGKHRVAIQRAGCQDDDFEINVPIQVTSASELEFRRVLRFRPATLVFEADVPKAAVFVDGVFKGSVDETAQNPVTIIMEDRRGRKEVTVRLTLPEGGALERKVTVAAGARTVFVAKRAEFAVPGDGGPK